MCVVLPYFPDVQNGTRLITKEELMTKESERNRSARRSAASGLAKVKSKFTELVQSFVEQERFESGDSEPTVNLFDADVRVFSTTQVF
jgi:hypothetical protein